MYLINIQYNKIIIEDCHPLKTKARLGFASVNRGFLGVTICNVTFSCSQYLDNIHLSYTFSCWIANSADIDGRLLLMLVILMLLHLNTKFADTHADLCNKL